MAIKGYDSDDCDEDDSDDEEEQSKRQQKGPEELHFKQNDSQLALQGHGGVNALPQSGAAVLQRGRHLGVHQTAAGVPLQRPGLPLLGRRHPRLLHAVELDWNTEEEEMQQLSHFILEEQDELCFICRHQPAYRLKSRGKMVDI